MNENYSSMSRGQRKLVSFITDNYDVAVFYTASELGKAVGVSESTVVRFAAALGYKGYPELQKELESWVHSKMMESRKTDIVPERLSKKSILTAMLKAEQTNLNETFATISEGALKQAADFIREARKVFIIGVRESYPMALILERQLCMLGLDIVNLSDKGINDMFDRLMTISTEDVVLGISFPRYSKTTLKVLEYANTKRAKVITLTDSVFSPLNMYSSCNLAASAGISADILSMVAPVSVINALCIMLLKDHEDRLVRNLEEMESFWDEYGEDCNDEIDHVSETLKNRYHAEKGNA